MIQNSTIVRLSCKLHSSFLKSGEIPYMIQNSIIVSSSVSWFIYKVERNSVVTCIFVRGAVVNSLDNYCNMVAFAGKPYCAQNGQNSSEFWLL